MTSPETSPCPTRRTALAAAGAVGAALVTGCSGGGDTVSGATLADASEIPVGGGKVLKDQKIVVTQPKAGQFKAFSAVCTHQGCIVDKVANGLIECPCHGSRFRITDGVMMAGPAPRPLPAVQIKVSDGTVSRA